MTIMQDPIYSFHEQKFDKQSKCLRKSAIKTL